MRRAAALAFCLMGCQFPPAPLPDLGGDGGPGRDGSTTDGPPAPDAEPPDAEIPDAAPDAFSCPEGFTQAGMGCYRIETDDYTWPGAEEQCEARGAHLVIIDSVQENTQVTQMATEAGLWYPWIGATDHAGEGVFRWVSDGFVLGGYTSWNGGEPNNGSGWGEEDCVELRPDGTWNDSGCDFIGDSICEWDRVPVGVDFW